MLLFKENLNDESLPQKRFYWNYGLNRNMDQKLIEVL